ncbi:MAG: RluA family pseudouridine synthase [Burkholderiales bacterium]|nr:RluA family pseudouridine synthase [Burkholderiales bacterium]
MNGLSKESVTWLDLDEDAEGQRVDNFLLRILKGVPKAHVYRILRSGEVRVNSRRADPTLRLHAGDRVRVPPIRISPPSAPPAPGGARVMPRVLHEDDALLVIDKPAGLAVHGGSGISHGVIERLRAERPELRFLELVHRLDRETSGVLLLAKRRSALTRMHEQIRNGTTGKRYTVLVKGRWTTPVRTIREALRKEATADGDRRVSVDQDGKPAITTFRLKRPLGDFTLLEADLKTGRTHQIRVHLAHAGYPIAGDDKYGDFALNRDLTRQGLKRMFLHAARFECDHPIRGDRIAFEAPLPRELAAFIATLDVSHSVRTA